MKSGVGAPRLVEVAEGALRRLGYGYAKSSSGGVVEFEVSTPARLVARVTRLEEVEEVSSVFGSGFPSRQGGASDFALVLDPGDPDSKGAGARLVAEVRGSLKDPPWKGLGFIESMTAKALWERASKP